MYSKKYIIETINNICRRFGFSAYECFDTNIETLKVVIKDRHSNTIDIIKIDIDHFTKDTLDDIWNKLSNAIPNRPAEKHTTGWRPISEYSRQKYDWVLVKYFDGSYECVPEVAEMRVDGKWYNRAGALIPDIFDVKYFFDMQQLDEKGEIA